MWEATGFTFDLSSNRYNQAPHLAQDTNGKVTASQLDITNESQEISPFQGLKFDLSIPLKAYWQIHSMLVLMASVQIPLINDYADVCMGAIGLKFDRSTLKKVFWQLHGMLVLTGL